MLDDVGRGRFGVVGVATPEPFGGSEPKPEDARPKPLTKFVYQIHFILKSLWKRFQFGTSP